MDYVGHVHVAGRRAAARAVCAVRTDVKRKGRFTAVRAFPEMARECADIRYIDKPVAVRISLAVPYGVKLFLGRGVARRMAAPVRAALE